MHEPVNKGEILFVSCEGERLFTHPVETVAAWSIPEVLPCLERIGRGVSSGLHAAGLLAYEASSAFDKALVTHEAGPFPLLWFGLYEEPMHDSSVPQGSFEVGSWRALVEKAAYLEALDAIREYIGAGDTYQVNYTFPMAASFEGDGRAWFRTLCQAQRGNYSAYAQLGRFSVLSASPELFFRLDDGILTTCPMKGTRPRGLWPAEDRRLAHELGHSHKDLAENVMIVDLLRNDMGRVSEAGSVKVQSLFDVERFETVWQMTSAISSHVGATTPAEIMTALFPCGSITGAPKVRTMEIIRELEPFARGAYCGTIGWWAPDGRAEFNVAIRTATIDHEEGKATYNVGGGITWASTPEGEYEEAQLKADVLTHRSPEFELLESLLWDGEYYLLDDHMKRLDESNEYFGFQANVEQIRAALLERQGDWARAVNDDDEGHGSNPIPHKVRLLVGRDGAFRIEAQPVAPLPPLRVGFAAEPVDERDVFLYHKTTHRTMYEHAKASRPDCNDVLLWNRRGEITETAMANVVLELDGRLLTPPLRCGLLGGTMRAKLLAEGVIDEAVLRKEDATRAASVRIINSVRKWVDVEFVG